MTSSAPEADADRPSPRDADRQPSAPHHHHPPRQPSPATGAAQTVSSAGTSHDPLETDAPPSMPLQDAGAPLPSIESANPDHDATMQDAVPTQNEHDSSLTVTHPGHEPMPSMVQPAHAMGPEGGEPVSGLSQEQLPPATPIKKDNQPDHFDVPAATTDSPLPKPSEPSNPVQQQSIEIKQEDTDTAMVLPDHPTREQQQAAASARRSQPYTPNRWNSLSQTPNSARNFAFSPSQQQPSGPLDPNVLNMIQVLQGMQTDVTAPSVTHVTPSQMMKQPMPDLADSGLPQPKFGDGSQQQEANDTAPLQSFARIEFEDSVFQMTTYAIIIGRDMKAIAAAKKDEKRQIEYQKRCIEFEKQGLPPPAVPKKFSKSYVSEEGGMLGPGSDSADSDRPAKRRKTNSAGSAEKKPGVQVTDENTMINRQYINHTPGAAPVNLDSLRPDPDFVPILPIHSPGPDMASKTRAISREHVKIAYNKTGGFFEAIPLHRNGFFHNDKHISEGRVVLRSGSRLQIKDVPFTFVIPGIERGKSGAEAKTAAQKKTGGKQMSFEFEHSHANGVMNDTSDDELSPLEGSSPVLSAFGDEKSPEAKPKAQEPVKAESPKAQPSSAPAPAPAEALPMEEAEPAAQSQPPPLPALPQPQPQPETTPQPPPMMAPVDAEGNEFFGPQLPPKKRGPGRPPKNGHTSRREQKEIDRARRAQEEEARKTLPQPAPLEPAPKRKVGRPRKHPLPENADGQGEKRKYKPRAPKLDGAEGSDAERRAKEKKEKRARAKSPPLSMRIEDFTAEQLSKPNKNYGQLLEETLDAHPEGLSLKQIYSRICKTWPWYYFFTETKGWESSVRHNLIGNEAFRKEESTGLWFRVPGIPLDQGKKRKQTSPDRALAQGQYGYGYGYPNQHMAQQGQYAAPGQMAMYQNMQQYGQQQHQHPQQQQHQHPQQQQQQQHMQPAQNVQQGVTQSGHVAQGQSIQAQHQQHQQQSQGQGPPLAQAPAGYGQQQPMQPRPQVAGQQAQPQMQHQGQQQQHQGQQQQQQQQQQQYSNPAFAARPSMPAQGQLANGQMAQTTQQPPQQGQPGVAAANGVPPAGASPGQAPAQGQPGVQGSQQGAPGQQPPRAARPNSGTPTSTSAARPVIDPRALQALVKLKNGLIGSLSNSRSKDSEAIVYSGLNICIGLRKQGLENKKMEEICVKGFARVIAGYNRTGTPATSGSAGSPPADTSGEPAVIFEDPKVLTGLTGFIDVTSKALAGRLGQAKAEAVALSAVNRTLGFTSSSIVALMTGGPAPEGEEGGGGGGSSSSSSSDISIESLEQYLMKSVTSLVEGMNLKVASPTA